MHRDPDRQRRLTHAMRKAGEARKQALHFKDGNGKHRATIAKARAAMR